MRLLLMMLIGILCASDIFQTGMSMGPGLSAKNALLYPIALGLIFRMALTGRFRVRLPLVNMAFAVWIGYAILTVIVCITVVHYPGFQPRATAISLKGQLIDAALFFFTFFYGAENESDFFALAKTLAFGIGVANILTLFDVAGIIHLHVTIGDSGVEADRVFGLFGHANDTGALMVCLVPMMAAVATSSRGWMKSFSYVGALASVAVLLLTVSRGAYVGAAVGYGWALWLCRRYLPTSRVMTWVLVGCSALIVAGGLAAALMPGFSQVFTERLLNQSMAGSVAEASSGRTQIWLEALDAMARHPVTFLTGYGFDVHKLWFVLVTHNFYLDQWFGLGLFGLFAFLTILFQTIRTALRAVAVADARLAPYMVAFVFGMLGLSVAIFFVNLDKPWSYVWVYMGFAARAASDALERSESRAAARAAEAASTPKPKPRPAVRAPAAAAVAMRRRTVGDVRR